MNSSPKGITVLLPYYLQADFKGLLENLGYDVIWADNSSDLIKMLEGHHIDIAIEWQHGPNDYPIRNLLRNFGSDTPILLSLNWNNVVPEGYKQEGYVDYLAVPWNIKELETKLALCVNRGSCVQKREEAAAGEDEYRALKPEPESLAGGRNMDNDNLFVCFSEEARSAPNGEPPFHEEIKKFTSSMTEKTFSDFYEKRFAWHWYPIITSGLSSFPVHGDLPEELTEAQRLQAIGYAASICAQEDRRRVISALGLLSLLCRAVETPQEVPTLTKNFMRIREAVTRNAIDPNIPYWFSKIAIYQLSSGVVPDGYPGSFDRAGLNAPSKGWRGYGTSLDFPPVDEYGSQHCPGGEELIRKEIQGIRGGDFVLEYQRSALHEGSKHWIWLYRNVSANPIWHWYVYAVTTPDGHTSVHRHSMHSVVNITPEELIAQHAFGLGNE